MLKLQSCFELTLFCLSVLLNVTAASAFPQTSAEVNFVLSPKLKRPPETLALPEAWEMKTLVLHFSGWRNVIVKPCPSHYTKCFQNYSKHSYHKVATDLGLKDLIKGTLGVGARLEREDIGHVSQTVPVVPWASYRQLFAGVIGRGLFGRRAWRIKHGTQRHGHIVICWIAGVDHGLICALSLKTWKIWGEIINTSAVYMCSRMK